MSATEFAYAVGRKSAAPGWSLRFELKDASRLLPSGAAVPTFFGLEGGVFTPRGRIGVLMAREHETASPNDYVRFLELEPAEREGEQALDFEGFYLRGRWRVVQDVSVASSAAVAWRSFNPT